MSYHVAWPIQSYVAIHSNSQNVPSILFHLISFALFNRMDCWQEGLEEILTQFIGLKKDCCLLAYFCVYGSMLHLSSVMLYIHGS